MSETVLAKFFSAMDTDNNGSISRAEMEIGFKLLDADGNGKLSLDEWKSAFSNKFGGNPDLAAKVFKYIDKSGAGEIKVDALYGLFKEMDGDGNGEVSRDEFTGFLKKLLA